jgi:hypothetical protein
VELKKKTRWDTIRKLLDGWHIEIARGNGEANVEYCSKCEDLALEDGTRKDSAGARTDLTEIREAARSGGMREVIKRASSYQQLRFAELLLKYDEPERDKPPVVIWLWGDSGVGKSRLAREFADGDRYVKNDGTRWWDGYDGHKQIILDDWRDSWWPITYFLGLIDRYGFRFEYKGGYRQCKATLFVITCPWRPEDCYRQARDENKTQLYRRITTIRECRADEMREHFAEVPDV